MEIIKLKSEDEIENNNNNNARQYESIEVDVKKENIVRIKELDGKKIRESFLDKRTNMLYNQSGISYFSNLNPRRTSSGYYHYFQIDKNHFFKLMEIENLEFPEGHRMDFDICQKEIINWSANICRMIDRPNGPYQFILKKEITFDSEEEYVKLSVNIVKNATFQIIYFDEEGKIALSRNISFKSKRAWGRNYTEENNKKKFKKQQATFKNITELQNVKDDDETDEEKKDKGEETEEDEDENDNYIFPNSYSNDLKRLKLESF